MTDGKTSDPCPSAGPNRRRSRHSRPAESSDPVTNWFVDLIERRRTETGAARGWKTALAQDLGIHPTHLSRIVNGGVSVGWSTAMEAAKRLGIDPPSFALRSAGSGRELKSEQGDEFELMRRIAELTPAARRALLTWARDRFQEDA